MFKEFQEQYSKKYNEELNKTGLFWAFSNEQFEENKTYKDAPYSEYSLVFNGGYIHKSDMPKLEKFFNNIVPALKKEFTDNIVYRIHSNEESFELTGCGKRNNHALQDEGLSKLCVKPVEKDYTGEMTLVSVIDSPKVYTKK